MRRILAAHGASAYLKPGEVFVSRRPVLVSTILGSCVAVTMYSPLFRIGAICHAIYPSAKNRDPGLDCVDTAIRHIYRKMIENGGGCDMVVKLFGGAKVLAGSGETRMAIGEMNILTAERTLAGLGLTIAKKDVGGICGRKLLFSIMTGDVYLRRLRSGVSASWLGE